MIVQPAVTAAPSPIPVHGGSPLEEPRTSASPPAEISRPQAYLALARDCEDLARIAKGEKRTGWLELAADFRSLFPVLTGSRSQPF